MTSVMLELRLLRLNIRVEPVSFTKLLSAYSKQTKFLFFKTNVAGLWLVALIAPRDCMFWNQRMHRVRLDPQPLRDLCTE